jgi:hypothetical protein
MAVGVPVMAPVLRFSARPGGSAPLAIDHVYGVVPPPALSEAEYPVPVTPLGSDMLVIWSGFVTAMLSVRDAVFCGAAASATWTVKEDGPALVGVPEIAPDSGSSVMPGGKLPDVIDQRYGEMPPVADTTAAYAEPVTPPGRDVVATVSVGGVVTLIDSMRVVFCTGREVSLTESVKVNVPGAEAVPLIAPVEGSSARPVGSAPAVIDHR